MYRRPTRSFGSCRRSRRAIRDRPAEKTEGEPPPQRPPAGGRTADKPGELDGVRVDAGVVFARNRPYVFSVMSAFLRDEGEGERAPSRRCRASLTNTSPVWQTLP